MGRRRVAVAASALAVLVAMTGAARAETISDRPCTNGKADRFACSGVDLLSYVPLSDFGGRRLPVIGNETSDIWGWTDVERGDEYVIIGKTNGVAFFRVTDPRNPVYLGDIVNPSVQLVWHDIKVYNDRAYMVSESQPYGMRVFDLTRLRDVTSPQVWIEDDRYPLTWSSHNVAINEETGFAYIVGGNVGLFAPDHCLGGLHMVDLKGAHPMFAGCWSGDRYIHDTQCVIYRGPDLEHVGKEICINSAEERVTIVDVTDKANPVRLGSTKYARVGYTHQGWLTEDHSYFVFGDEGDETEFKMNTRTLVLDVRDLDQPLYHGQYIAQTRSIDHNLFIRDGLVFQSNYTAGLRVLTTANIADRANPLSEVAYFDTHPDDDIPEFEGTWSNYAFFESGTIAVASMGEGLFLLKLHDGIG